jgi:hypothetical protein
MLAVVRHSPDIDDPHADNIAEAYTWSSVFKRTQAVYDAVVRR